MMRVWAAGNEERARCAALVRRARRSVDGMAVGVVLDQWRSWGRGMIILEEKIFNRGQRRWQMMVNRVTKRYPSAGKILSELHRRLQDKRYLGVF
jgi:hypothetical protein